MFLKVSKKLGIFAILLKKVEDVVGCRLELLPIECIMVLPHRNEPAIQTERSLREGSEKRCSFPRSSQHRYFWKNGSTGTRIIEG